MRIVFFVLSVFIFIGCSTKNCSNDIIVKQDVQKVYIPVKVNIPEIDCNFDGEGTEPIYNLIACLAKHKKILDELRLQNN